MQDVVLTLAGLMPLGIGFVWLVGATVAVLALCAMVVRSKINTAREAVSAIGWALALGATCSSGIILVLMFGFKRITGEYSVMDMFAMKHDHYGRLLIVDPNTMQIVTQITTPERCSYARMAIYPGETGDHDWVVTLGDYSVMKWKYSHATKALELATDWSEGYRTFNDGSFYGTGPAVYNDTVYYTDNTFPVMLRNGYRLYAKPLHTNEPQKMVQLSPNAPGFMFWSVTISPMTNSLLVWDMANSNIQSRDLHSLDLQWEVSAKNMDCLSVAADKGHVYATETFASVFTLSDYLFMNGLLGGRFYRGDKYFLVIDAATGHILHRLPLSLNAPLSAGLIAPGANDDVFVTNDKGLLRIHHNGAAVPEPGATAADLEFGGFELRPKNSFLGSREL